MLNSGKIAAIRTDVTTILSRVTAAVAVASTALSNATWTNAKAAFLDAAISSRAAASTALSSATWTGTKAGYLDAAVSDAGLKVPSEILVPPLYYSASPPGSIPSVSKTQSITGNWLDFISITGSSGVLSFINALCVANTGSENIQVRLVIDGVVVFSETVFTSSSDEDSSVTLVGGLSIGLSPTGGTAGFLAFEQMIFKTSLSFSVKQTTVGSTTVKGFYRYYLTD
jgi:hypothetical protein